ncbi:MAG: hypothetical protein JST50_12565 [Bacteroidetes bacterium]|nr:hypothetical protein [Bacteroidota bacterium]
MEQDLKDIDLIDRYLNNELDEQQQQVFKNRYLNDPDFKKEVEAYQKIYEGIEKAGRDSLKQRLEGYYNEYIDKDLSIEEDHKIIPIGKWRSNLLVISGIAASVLLVAFGIWYYTLKETGTSQQIAQAPNNTKIDSGGKPGQYAGTKNNPSTTTPVKKNNPTLPVNKGDQYGLTTEGKVNTVRVLSVLRPGLWAYTFKDGLLSIYNNPSLGMIRLHVFKTGDQYNLWYDGDVYKLNPTASIQTLIKTGQSEDFGTKTTEAIKVQVEPLQASANTSDNLTVRLQKADQGQYFFRKEKGKMILELQGNFVPADCKVINVKTPDSHNWYLVNKSEVYALDEKNIDPTRLKELSGFASEEARLFIKRELVIVPVYARK